MHRFFRPDPPAPAAPVAPPPPAWALNAPPAVDDALAGKLQRMLDRYMAAGRDGPSVKDVLRHLRKEGNPDYGTGMEQRVEAACEAYRIWRAASRPGEGCGGGACGAGDEPPLPRAAAARPPLAPLEPNAPAARRSLPAASRLQKACGVTAFTPTHAVLDDVADEMIREGEMPEASADVPLEATDEPRVAPGATRSTGAAGGGVRAAVIAAVFTTLSILGTLCAAFTPNAAACPALYCADLSTCKGVRQLRPGMFFLEPEYMLQAGTDLLQADGAPILTVKQITATADTVAHFWGWANTVADSIIVGERYKTPYDATTETILEGFITASRGYAAGGRIALGSGMVGAAARDPRMAQLADLAKQRAELTAGLGCGAYCMIWMAAFLNVWQRAHVDTLTASMRAMRAAVAAELALAATALAAQLKPHDPGAAAAFAAAKIQRIQARCMLQDPELLNCFRWITTYFRTRVISFIDADGYEVQLVQQPGMSWGGDWEFVTTYRHGMRPLYWLAASVITCWRPAR